MGIENVENGFSSISTVLGIIGITIMIIALIALFLLSRIPLTPTEEKENSAADNTALVLMLDNIARGLMLLSVITVITGIGLNIFGEREKSSIIFERLENVYNVEVVEGVLADNEIIKVRDLEKRETFSVEVKIDNGRLFLFEGRKELYNNGETE